MKKTIRKRILSSVVSAALFLTAFLSVFLYTEKTAYASGTGKALQLGTAVLSDNAAQANAAKVYFGRREELWRVINYDGTGALSYSGEGNLTLFDAGTSGVFAGQTTFSAGTPNNNYGISALKGLLDNAYSGTAYFDTREKRAMVKRELYHQTYSAGPPYIDGIEGPSLTGNNAVALWPLSAKEADTLCRTLEGDTDNFMLPSEEHARPWWLRSPAYAATHAVHVIQGGPTTAGLDDADSGGTNYVRAAFHVDLDSVLFTSSVYDGNDLATDGKCLAESGKLYHPADYVDGTPWKLTLIDPEISVSLNGPISRETQQTGGVTEEFVRVMAGRNPQGDDTMSNRTAVLVTDKDYRQSDAQIMYYGMLNAAGFVIPGDFDPDYKVYILAELYNSDDPNNPNLQKEYTDYASVPMEITVPAAEGTAITFDPQGGTPARTSCVTDRYGKIAFPADPVYAGHDFTGWNTEPDGSGDFVNADTVFKKAMTVYAIWDGEDLPQEGPAQEDSPAPSKSSARANPDAIFGVLYLNGKRLESAKMGKQKQGPLGEYAFAAGRPAGYREAFSFNITVNDKADYSNKKGVLSLYIPREFQKNGRTFAITALDEKGKVHLFSDIDTSPETITCNIDINGYAFDLIYKD